MPIIGANIAGVDFDFLFARIMAPTVPDDLDLSDDNVLRGMDDANQRSLNGASPLLLGRRSGLPAAGADALSRPPWPTPVASQARA